MGVERCALRKRRRAPDGPMSSEAGRGEVVEEDEVASVGVGPILLCSAFSHPNSLSI